MATRILYVITKANWGGAQRYVYDLATAAKEAGYEVAVAYGEPGVLKEKLSSSGIRGIETKMRNKASFFAFIQAYRELYNVYLDEKPAIVHLNSSLASAAGALAARIAGVPMIIFTAHGWAFNEDRPWWQKIIIGIFHWLTIVLSNKTICVSNAMRSQIDWMPFISSKCSVIHNGISCPPLLSKEKARAALAPRGIGQYWIGMISELIPTKRVEDAIRAFALLVPKHPEAILIVLGEGREREYLEEIVRELHLGNHVSLQGFRGDAISLLKAFDLFIHSSFSESFGLVILEAGCASLPVVATRIGGIPEIIPDDDYGLLVPPQDTNALAAAIESLMRDQHLAAELGARLHARVQNFFSKEKMIAETLSVYNH